MNVFGTDGVRGKVNEWPMTAELVQKLAISAGSVYIGKAGSNLNRVIIGKDTRLSGYMLEPALVSGFTSMGMDCLTLGPIPTPGVSRLTRSFRADLGVMISASHNPSEDNGIKLFGPDGLKLSDNMENEISKLLNKSIKLAEPNALGRVRRLEDAVGRYIEAVKSCINKEQRLEGIRIVVDCANGAAYKAAPQALFELGAEVITIGVDPDGFNINKDCGAVYPEKMSKAVVSNQADIGIAFDAIAKAGEIALRFEKDKIEFWNKSVGQPVTHADLEINIFLKSFFEKYTPEFGWLSEESEDDNSRFEKKFFWCVDPIDGTRSYINKRPEYVISIALVSNTTPIFGLIFNPKTNEMFSAEKSLGAFCNKKRIKVSNLLLFFPRFIFFDISIFVFIWVIS